MISSILLNPCLLSSPLILTCYDEEREGEDDEEDDEEEDDEEEEDDNDNDSNDII